jgi:micrococcal nuclease
VSPEEYFQRVASDTCNYYDIIEITDSMNLLESIAALLAVVFAWWSYPSAIEAPTESVAKVVAVIDGDTIIVQLDGQEETVRYIGIDTPEPRREGTPECGSHEATVFNRALVEGKTVRLVADSEDRDRYDRLLRYVYIPEGDGEVFVNTALVQAGLATPLTIPPNDTYEHEFERLTTDARSAKVGNWSLCAAS